MDMTISSFKIKLVKALATTKYNPFLQKNNVEAQMDYFWPRLNSFD